jgi:hypothetical protein
MTATQMIGLNLVTGAALFVVLVAMFCVAGCVPGRDSDEDASKAASAFILLTALAIITEWGLWMLL